MQVEGTVLWRRSRPPTCRGSAVPRQQVSSIVAGPVEAGDFNRKCIVEVVTIGRGPHVTPRTLVLTYVSYLTTESGRCEDGSLPPVAPASSHTSSICSSYYTLYGRGFNRPLPRFDANRGGVGEYYNHTYGTDYNHRSTIVKKSIQF